MGMFIDSGVNKQKVLRSNRVGRCLATVSARTWFGGYRGCANWGQDGEVEAVARCLRDVFAWVYNATTDRRTTGECTA